MNIAHQMAIFVKTVDEGGLSAAARSLGISPSAVSKQLRRLEDHLKVRLLNRSSRGVTLTDNGRVLYERCAHIAQAIEEAEAFAASVTGYVGGKLRVVATVAFAKAQLLPLFQAFLNRYPELELDIEVSDRNIDLVEEGIDVAIRFTEQVHDSSLVARKIATNRRVVVASPAYLAARGVPAIPGDLRAHNCLRLSTVSSWNNWEFANASGREVIHACGNFKANSADAVYHAVLAGLGIARLSTYLVAQDIGAGRLVQLLPEYTHDTSDIMAVYSNRRNLSPKVRAFIDFLVEHFGPVPPWERDQAACDAIDATVPPAVASA